MVAAARWDALGGWCEVLTLDSADLPAVAELASARVAALDESCSRFRDDSEIACLPWERTQVVSPVLAGALDAALRAAEFSDGRVDPTLAGAMRASGYTSDYSAMTGVVASAAGQPIVGGAWRAIRFNRETREVVLPEGAQLDLGAVGKAWAADWIADACAAELGIGVLVNLGGDIAVRGRVPEGGWQVEIDDGHHGPQGRPVISMGWPGGLATSSTVTRTWRTDAGEAHHILDPGTGRPAARHWRTVTVAARSCERANAASTAAIVLGDSAPRWLTQRELPARLVHTGGVVVQTNGWPRQRFLT